MALKKHLSYTQNGWTSNQVALTGLNKGNKHTFAHSSQKKKKKVILNDKLMDLKTLKKTISFWFSNAIVEYYVMQYF